MPRRNLDDLHALASLHELARSQSGAVSRGQARALGLSEGGFARAQVIGAWRTLHRGVHYVGRGDPGLHARMWGAHLALGGSGVIAGAAAGLYWGLLAGTLAPDEPILMLVDARAPDTNRPAHEAGQGTPHSRAPGP